LPTPRKGFPQQTQVYTARARTSRKTDTQSSRTPERFLSTALHLLGINKARFIPARYGEEGRGMKGEKGRAGKREGKRKRSQLDRSDTARFLDFQCCKFFFFFMKKASLILKKKNLCCILCIVITTQIRLSKLSRHNKIFSF
jgi:hypothetical protein